MTDTHNYRWPALNLGQSGPVRTVTGDEDPDFEPPPFLGFTHVVWWKPETGEVLAVAELGEPIAADDHEPLLWEGDQA